MHFSFNNGWLVGGRGGRYRSPLCSSHSLIPVVSVAGKSPWGRKSPAYTQSSSTRTVGRGGLNSSSCTPFRSTRTVGGGGTKSSSCTPFFSAAVGEDGVKLSIRTPFIYNTAAVGGGGRKSSTRTPFFSTAVGGGRINSSKCTPFISTAGGGGRGKGGDTAVTAAGFTGCEGGSLVARKDEPVPPRGKVMLPSKR